jgi:glutamate synthase (ferredoxin)
MTGGSVTILGPTGRNFGAGMSGGIAYLYDPDNTAASRCNLEMATLLPVTDAAEIDQLKANLDLHVQHTGSRQAKRLLENWPAAVASFRKFVPNDYARMLACIQKAQAAGLTGESALEAAFAENMKDPSRVSGN